MGAIQNGDAAGLGNDKGCQFIGVQGGDFTCEITNTAQDAVFEVNKVWEIIGTGGDLVEQKFDLGIRCTEEILSGTPTPTVGPVKNNGKWFVKWLNLVGDTKVSATVDSTNGTADCAAKETILDSAVMVDNPCIEDQSLSRGETTSCTITNTVFFEGIPTLNRYRLALLALLMLGIGAVGLRRFSKTGDFNKLIADNTNPVVARLSRGFLLPDANIFYAAASRIGVNCGNSCKKWTRHSGFYTLRHTTSGRSLNDPVF